MPSFRAVRRRVAVIVVVVATLAGGASALALYERVAELSVGRIALSVSLFHDGALDVYVPVVDWGARFPAVRLPVRLEVDVRAVDRTAVRQLATGGSFSVARVRGEARDAIASYIRAMLAVIFAASLAAGALAALVVRGGASPRKRVLFAVAGGTALVATVGVALTLPPRGTIDRPQYYANGPDIPRALDALQDVRRSSARLSQELDAQLVGLARLVTDPGQRPEFDTAPQLTIASDLHNNFLTIPVLERATDGNPILFAGDLTDRGSPLETALVRRIVKAGRPFVFVSGNHDSDTLVDELESDGAIVLDREVRTVKGVRIAGYPSPDLRLSSDDYADRYEPDPDPAEQEAFATWLRPLIGEVDVVMVHDVRQAAVALAELEQAPPLAPLVFVTGHTHRASLTRRGNVTIVDGGSIGGGGTGNLAEEETPVALAELAYETEPFRPLAVDLVEIDPGRGSATARREPLDEPAD